MAMQLIANLPNSAQLEGTPYHSPELHLGPCSSVESNKGQTDARTNGRDRYTFRVVYDSNEL